MKRNRMRISRKLIMVFMLAMVMMAGMIVCAQAGEAGGEIYSTSETVTFSVSEKDYPSNDEMKTDYLRRAFYGGSVSLRKGSTAGFGLTGAELRCYNALKPLIAEVAEGTRTSTVFSVSGIFEKTSFSYRELGLTSTDASEDEVKAALAVKVALGNQYLKALLYDCPYDLYWFDKTIVNDINYFTKRRNRGKPASCSAW